MDPFSRIGLLLLCVLAASAQAPVPKLTPAQRAEAGKLIQQIEKDPRGPFGAIQWYCKDGRVLPVNTPCGKTGGFQHAAPSAAAQRLAALNIDVAPFLAGMPYETYFDAKRNHYLLRELLMLDYLVGRESGWIFAKTYSRRGVRQVEDEEAEGRRLLMQLLSDTAWVKQNYLLTMLAGSATPHGVDTGRTKQIRALSAALAENEPRFQPLRGKIHSKPEADDIEAVEVFLKEKSPANPEGYQKLILLMKEEYLQPSAKPWDTAAEGKRSLDLRDRLTAPGLTPKERLAVLDEQLKLQGEAVRAGANRPSLVSRRERLIRNKGWLQIATGAGLLSTRQLTALTVEIDRALARPELTAEQYRELTTYIESSLEWARAAVAREVTEVQSIWSAVNDHADGLADDLLRRSVVLTLSNRVELLTREADELSGRNHQIFGLTGSRGVRGLNAGGAIAKIEIVENAEGHLQIEPDRIYVIPSTIAELKPMKGIITLDSGNMLSHAQLLAANLGLPNSTLPSSLLPELRKHQGKEVFYAVTPRGTVVLKDLDSMTPEEKARWQKRSGPRQKVKLDTSKVNLNDRRLLRLEETGMRDSGIRSGPKASNLGELKKLFPDQVAPGLVIPFGIYYQHITRKDASGGSIAGDIATAFAEAERLRQSGATPEQLRAYVNPKLADIRQRIKTMTLDPAFVEQLRNDMTQVFGPDGSYGVFVRSDTNVEDLPQFTGAGLNLTVPNVVGFDNVLKALREVWSSPFEERAYGWRMEALESTDKVYPSVVLLKTVTSDKSGVMATANLSTMDPNDITVNVNEGPAAVVDGGVAESLLLRANGTSKLLAQARSPYRKLPSPKGGIVEIPTSGSDFVLGEQEIRKLRQFAAEVQTKLKPEKDARGQPLPWDIEFGFENGDLRLFQIRPLARYREAQMLDALGALDSSKGGQKMVKLDAQVGQ